MFDSLRTGMFSGVRLGCSAQEVVSALGEPDEKSGFHKWCEEYTVWRYGCVEVQFHPKRYRASRITVDGGDSRNGNLRNGTSLVIRDKRRLKTYDLNKLMRFFGKEKLATAFANIDAQYDGRPDLIRKELEIELYEDINLPSRIVFGNTKNMTMQYDFANEGVSRFKFTFLRPEEYARERTGINMMLRQR